MTTLDTTNTNAQREMREIPLYIRCGIGTTNSTNQSNPIFFFYSLMMKLWLDATTTTGEGDDGRRGVI